MFLSIAGSTKRSIVAFKAEGATTLGTDFVFCEQDAQSPQFFQFYTHSWILNPIWVLKRRHETRIKLLAEYWKVRRGEAQPDSSWFRCLMLFVCLFAWLFFSSAWLSVSLSDLFNTKNLTPIDFTAWGCWVPSKWLCLFSLSLSFCWTTKNLTPTDFAAWWCGVPWGDKGGPRACNQFGHWHVSLGEAAKKMNYLQREKKGRVSFSPEK